MPGQRQGHGQGMGGDLVHVGIRHIGDPDAVSASRRDIDVIDAHAQGGNQAQPRQGRENLLRDRRIACHEGVDSLPSLDNVLRAPALRHGTLDTRGLEHFMLQVRVGLLCVGQQDLHGSARQAAGSGRVINWRRAVGRSPKDARPCQPERPGRP
jgi:hypothetical protein